MKENKLIAEFMGWKPNEHHWCLNGDKDLQYHTSWDWLMPVVEKVNKTPYKIVISSNVTELFDKEDNFIDFQGGDIKVNTYKAVVEFIQYKNQEL